MRVAARDVRGQAARGTPPADSGIESVACILCGSNETEPKVSAPDRYLGGGAGRWYQVVRCRRCALCFQNPRPTAERLVALYPEHYYAYQPTQPKSARGLSALGRWLERWSKLGLRRAFWGYPCPGGALHRWALRFILWPLWMRMQVLGKDLKVIPYTGEGRFLDVGCGTGRDLAYQRDFGLRVAGVEWNASAAEAARAQYGIDVRAGSLEQANFPDRAFDVIHMSHVFEHVPNPAATLDEAHRLLDANGLIILKVPNMDSASAERFGTFWLGLDLPRHFYHFSPTTMTRLLTQHGFAVERIRPDPGAWGVWRESHRFEARDRQGREAPDRWWRDRFFQAAETVACWRGLGSVMAVYARKVSPQAPPEDRRRLPARLRNAALNYYFRKIVRLLQPAEYRRVKGLREQTDALISVQELLFLRWVVRVSRAQTVVEIGSYSGASTSAIAEVLKWRRRGRVYAIDLFAPPADNGARRRGYEGTFDQVMAPYAGWFEKIEGDSKTVPWQRSIDLLFIDGDHSEAGVSADIQKYAPLVRPGGCVLLHDYLDAPDGHCRVKSVVDSTLGCDPAFRLIGQVGSLIGFRKLGGGAAAARTPRADAEISAP